MMFFRSNQSPSPVRIVRQSCQQAGGGGSTQDYVKLRRRFVPEPARGSLARDERLSRGGRATGSAQRAAAAAEISPQTNERRSESPTTNFQLAGLFISRIATGFWSAIQTQASIDSLKCSCIVTPARASLLLFILCCLSGSFIEALQRHDAQTDCVSTTSTSTTFHRHDQQWGSSPADRDHLGPQNVARFKRDIVLNRNQKRNQNQNQQPSFNSDLDPQQQSVEMGEQVNDELAASSGALAEQPTSQLPAASSTQEFPLPSGQDNLFATYSHGLDVPLRSQQAASMLTLAVVAPASSMESNSDSNDNNNNSNSNSNSNNNNNNENGSYRRRFYQFYHHNYRPSALLLERQLEETSNGADDEARRRARPPAEANEPNEKRATTSRANDLESSASASVPTRRSQAQVADKSDSPRTPDAAPAAAAAAAAGAAARRPLTSGQRRRRRRRRPDQRAAVGGEQTSPAASDTITAHRMRAAARLTSVSRATPAVASSPAVARGESQWIPIVTSDQRRNNRISRLVDTTTTTTTTTAAAVATGAQVTSANHGQASSSVAQAASNQAASTLLDFRSPAALSEPLLAQNGHQPRPPSRQDGGGQAPPPAAGNQQPQQQRARERQQAAGSRVHGNRHRHQHAYTPPYYNQLQQQQQQQPAPHWHRRPRQHQHHQQHQRPARHHRRPRLNSNHETDGLEQEAPEFRPSKVYKRVLLCDKTLVSLDYIRHLEAEPRPSAEQFLSELEINEISDNFISDLDGAYEILARSAASPAGEQSRPNSTTIDLSQQQQQPPPSGNASASGLPEPLEGNVSNRAGLLLSLERRLYGGGGAARALLSDADPLVRCDMWDLEKGLKSRKPPEAILRAALKADFDTVRDAINRCRQLSERTLPPDEEPRDGLEMLSTEDLASLFSMKRGLIPGTKWCGLGDQASSYNDLGPKHRIDICCRAHDHCPIRSKPFRNDYGVLNIGLYTKSHCDCDADFYRCLRGVRSRTADMLGNLYFNVMKLQCMREERLKVCREMKPIALGFERCIRYEPSPSKTVFKFTTPPVAY